MTAAANLAMARVAAHPAVICCNQLIGRRPQRAIFNIALLMLTRRDNSQQLGGGLAAEV